MNDRITGEARVAAVIGHPIGHSMSPILHNYWFDKYAINGVYVPLDIAPTDLPDVIRGLRKAGLYGLNVTIPHKVATLDLVDELTPEAQAVGAVNTVIFRSDRSSLGMSTDGSGFILNLLEQAPALDLPTCDVTILGAGGAARSIAFALLQSNARSLRIINRNRHRADQLAESLAMRFSASVRADGWEQLADATQAAGLLINTTSAGMKGHPELDIDLGGAASTTVVADIVYNPLRTRLLDQASARGLTIVDGLGMLLQQAVPGFEHWGGVTPTIDVAIRRLIVNKLGL